AGVKVSRRAAQRGQQHNQPGPAKEAADVAAQFEIIFHGCCDPVRSTSASKGGILLPPVHLSGKIGCRAMPITDQVRPGDIWPNATQQLLLQAALLSGEAASAAWRAWRSSVDPQRLDVGSHRLLPLLYHNLRALGVDDPSLPYYKTTYR